jgi:hypothetical protein
MLFPGIELFGGGMIDHKFGAAHAFHDLNAPG